MNSEQKEKHELIFYKDDDGEFRFDKRFYLKLDKRETVVGELKCGRFGLSNEVFFFTFVKGKYGFERLFLNIIPEGKYQAERILIDSDTDLYDSIRRSVDPQNPDPSFF